MKKQRTMIIMTAAVLAAVLAACGPKEQEPTHTQAPLPAPMQTVKPTLPVETTPAPAPTPTPAPDEVPQWTEQTWSSTPCAEDGTLLMTAECSLPAAGNRDRSAVGAVITDWYAAQLRTFVSDAESAAEWVQADYELSQSTDIPFTPAVQTMTSKVTYLSDYCVSFQRELYVSMSGAAHPSVFRLGEQFDLETGRLLGFADLVNDPERALTLFREAIPKYNRTEADSALLQQLFFADNFYLTDEGFTFWFQGEGLTANSPVEVTVPYEEGKDVLASWIAP